MGCWGCHLTGMCENFDLKTELPKQIFAKPQEHFQL